MGREIKFRAWDKEINSIISWEDFRTKYYNTALKSLSGEKPYNHMMFMQYTGLKDKNGKEIYEGDIVTDELDDDKRGMLVQWEDGAFFANNVMLSMAKDYLEIIGNIYENPELLTKGTI